GPDPVRPPHPPQLWVVDRRLLRLQLLEPAHKVAEELVGEPRADLADPPEGAVHVRPDQQGPERGAPSPLSRRPPEHHAVLPVEDLDLPPVRRSPPRQVEAGSPLRHHPFESELLRLLVEGHALALDDV